jgi:hypothetical protein
MIIWNPNPSEQRNIAGSIEMIDKALLANDLLAGTASEVESSISDVVEDSLDDIFAVFNPELL